MTVPRSPGCTWTCGAQVTQTSVGAVAAPDDHGGLFHPEMMAVRYDYSPRARGGVNE